MKYLKEFENHSLYSAFTDTDEFIKPNVSICVRENDVHYNPLTDADRYLTFTAQEDTTFTFTPKNGNVVSFSTDGGNTWTEGNSVEVGNRGMVMWRGSTSPVAGDGVGSFGSSGNFVVQGNVMSLLYGDGFRGQKSLTGKDYAFYGLFTVNDRLISAERLCLPATDLSECCYDSMFSYCTNLVSAPKLPSAELSEKCYQSMFLGCSSLVEAPELPAETLSDWCYADMFSGCTSLSSAPELPATELADYCYYRMFEGCTGIIMPPELPVTELADWCYAGMFYGCTSLTRAPELPATTLTKRCYSYMLGRCTSLITAPDLIATDLATECYYFMFEGSSSLNYIKAMFTTAPGKGYTSHWVDGVASIGTFVKNSAATWTLTGINGIPSGWAVETESE